MGGANVRRNFVGDRRGCSSCGDPIVVTERMARTGSYRCPACLSRTSVESAQRNRDRKRANNNAHQRRISGQRASSTRQYRQQHPEAAAAHQAVQTALRNGSIEKGPCEECGSTTRVHAHHDDYSKPLIVRWRCHRHHMSLHHSSSALREA